MGIKGLTNLLAEHAPRAAVQRRVEDYRGRVIAVDASLSIYQFLTVVGRKGSELLTNESGEVTSHLQGMLYLTVRMLEAGIKPVFVFDGEPPEMKKKELAKRSLKRDDATKDLNRAIEIGDEGSVEKFSKRTVKVTKRHSDDCKRLLRLMGAPVVEAPGGAKAQCASLCENHQVYAVASEDMDSLTFGARRFLCHLTDLGYKKSLVTEFEVSKVLEALELTMNQFIDLCILSGCDYCENIKGIAGRRALELIRRHGCIEEVLQNLKQTRFSVPEDWPYQEVRTLFKEPHVCTGIPDFMWTAPDLEGLMNFLSTENNFSPDRVEKAVEKIKAARDRYSPGRLPLTPVAGMPGSHTEKGLPIVAHSVTPGLAAVSVGIPPAATREKLWDESSETLFCTCYVDFLHQWKDFKMMSVEEKFSKIAEAMNAKSEKKFAHWQLYSKFKKLKQRYEAHVHPPKKGTTQYWKKKERGDAMFRKMKTGEPPPNLDLLKVIVEAEKNKQEQLSKCQNECVPMKKYVDECTERRRLNDELIELKQQLSKCQNECVPMKKYVDECTERRRLNDELIELKGNIRVFCRCRPLSAEEIDHGCSSVVSIDQTDVLILLSEKEKKTFRFDSVFGPDASQESVFAETRPLIRSAMDGSNVCIFAYGQTGTGKTFTMEGPPERRGVNYKSLEELFKISEERRMCIQYTFSVSVLEIYNEQIYDLLADRSKLEIKLSADGTPDVLGLNDSQIYDIDGVWKKLKAGNKNRSVGSTDANKLSSRSHSFVRVTVCSEHLVTGQQSKSYIWLVDLAGSERNEKTGAGGERLKESQYINKSLSALGDVMSALASESSHIPYRNSKLTHLLQNGLGEDAKSLMFVHISPSSSDSLESVSSLAFASRVRAVQCKGGDHLKLKKMTVKVKQLQKENEELKRMLQDKDKDKRTIRDFVISPTSRPPLIRTRQRQPPQGSNTNCFTPTPSRSRVGKATIQNKENISMMGTKAKQAQYKMHVAEMEALRAGMPPVFVNHNNDAGPAVRDIHMENFSVTVGGRDLIQEATITLAFGRHYGLVGRNGTGKTSFLRAMAMHAIDGIPKNCQILHVEQEVVGDDTTALQCVLNADVERVQLLQEEARLVQQQKDLEIEAEFEQGSVKRLEEIYKRLEFIDADAAEARAASILAGLSFTPEMQCKRTKQFSGGWRMRIALARALFIEPDLLLLDEPTNHLDLHAVLWLETYLLKWPKTFIVVSHAREFLNTVVTDILHLHGRKLHAYKGDYDTFERTREEHLKNQHKAFETNEKARSHMQAFIDKFRYNAKRASLVQLRIKALERMEHVDAVVSDPDYKFEFPTTDDRPGPPIISFRDASFGYPGGPILFKNLNFGIDLDSRTSMVGPNGIGKSTILKLISGDLQPTSGTVFRSPKVRMAVFNEHHVDGLDLTVNPLLYMMRCYPGVPEQKLRSHLGSFGVSGNLALQPMYTLSGGQKSRVAFAQITFKKPHIILLDEPSNHLDLDAVEALIQGLLVFQGGVLMVSHDEHLITGSVDHLWVVSEGRVTPFSGTFKDYKKMLKP